MALPIIAEGEDRHGCLHQHRDWREGREGIRQVAAGAGAAVFMKTYGCSHNVSDSEQMAGILAAHGYRIVGDEAHADICLINSCTVKGPSQDSLLSMVRRLKARRMPLVVAGCVPQADRGIPELADVSLLGVQQFDLVASAVERTLAGETVRLLGKERRPPLSLPKVRRNRLIEIIPISVGCLSACAYCKTKHARGHLASERPEDIIRRALSAIDEGAVQLWLTGEDCGAYGKDIGSSLPALLRELLPLLPEHVMVRIGMANPQHVARHADELARILRHPRVFSFLHVPVQSGSDKVLHAMKRGYTAQEFQRVVDSVREQVPGLAIATDIICGFPGEDDADFGETLDLVRRNEFPILNISQFYPRPGTPASRMALLPTREVKRRSSRLTALFRSQRPYAPLVGTEQDVWVSAVNPDGMLVGHTKSYVLVLLPFDETLLGRRVRARMLSAGKHFVRAQACGPAA